MNTRVAALLGLIFLGITIAAAYYLAVRGKQASIRRAASLGIAIVSGLAAYVGTAGYAISALEEFRTASTPLFTAITVNVLIWALCIGAWIIAVRFAILGLRRK